jgi:hypothetical protein
MSCSLLILLWTRLFPYGSSTCRTWLKCEDSSQPMYSLCATLIYVGWKLPQQQPKLVEGRMNQILVCAPVRHHPCHPDPSYFLKAHGKRVWELLIYNTIIYPLLDTFEGGPNDTIIANINTLIYIKYPTPVQEWTAINVAFIIYGLALEGQSNTNIVPTRAISTSKFSKFYMNMPIYFFVMGSFCSYCRSHVFKRHWTSFIKSNLESIENNPYPTPLPRVDQVMYVIYHVHNSINYECQVGGLDMGPLNVFTAFARNRYTHIRSIHLLSWNDFSNNVYPRLAAGHNKLDFTL